MTDVMSTPTTASGTAEGNGVFLPGDSGYEQRVLSWNSAVTHAPAVVVAATSTSDVQTAVRYAAALGERVRVQATGHGALRPAQGGILIDTSALRGVTIDPGSATADVAAGTPMADVITAAAVHGLAPLSGSTSHVSAAGYALGGGTGFLVRRHGLCADSIEAIEIVTADGRVRWLNIDSDPELFAAVKGSGANFGVVTRLRLGLFPVADVYAGGLYWPVEQAGQVLAAYRAFTAEVSPHITSEVDVLHFPDAEFVPEPMRGQSVVRVLVCSVGDPDETDRLLTALRGIPALLLDEVQTTPYTSIDSLANDPTDPLPVAVWTAGLDELTDEVLHQIEAISPRGAHPYMVLQLRHAGGPGSAAEGLAPFLLHAVCGAFDPVAVGTFLGELLTMFPKPSAYRVPLSFVGDPAAIAQAYSPQRLTELRELKRRRDPRGMFGGDRDFDTDD